jgi:maleate isomerase
MADEPFQHGHEPNARVRGWQGRIGLVSPDDAMNDDEYWLYPPDGVSVLMTRYTTAKRDDAIAPDMVDAYGDLATLARAADTLKITRPSALVFACTSCSFVRGPGFDIEQARAISRACSGAPATTVSTAMVAALRTMGIRTVALGAPYPDSVTAKFQAFLEGHGIRVLTRKALGMTTEWQIGNSPPAVWHDLARAVDRPEAEAVVISCTGIRTAAILQAAEAELGKPVIAAPQAMMWHPLQLMGVDATRPDRGALFSRWGAAFRTIEAARIVPSA